MADTNRPQEDPVEGLRKTIERELDRTDQQQDKGHAGKKSGVEDDAKGQYKKTGHGRTNDGVASAEPRVFSGKDDGDATWPLKQGNRDE